MFPTATNKDLSKDRMNAYYQTKDYDSSALPRASSDISLDRQVMAARRIRRMQKIENEKRRQSEEWQAKLAEKASAVGSQMMGDEHNAAILQTWGQYTGEHFGTSPERNDRIFAEQEEAAINLIAGDNTDRLSYLQRRHRKANMKRAVATNDKNTKEMGCQPSAEGETKAQHGCNLDVYEGYRSRIDRQMDDTEVWHVLAVLLFLYYVGGSLFALLSLAGLVTFTLYNDNYDAKVPIEPRKAIGIIWKRLTARWFKSCLKRLRLLEISAHKIKILERIIEELLYPDQTENRTPVENRDDDKISELRHSGLAQVDVPYETKDARLNRKQAQIQALQANLKSAGTRLMPAVRKIHFDEINSLHASEYPLHDRHTGEWMAARVAHVKKVRTYTPIFGIRPSVQLIVEGVSAKLLLDTGANCSAFDQKFLDKIEKAKGITLRAKGSITVKGYAKDPVKQDVTTLQIACPNSTSQTRVPVIVNNNDEELGYDGICGTNLMETFRMGISWPQHGSNVIITQCPDPENGEVKIQAAILEENDEHPVSIYEIHRKIRQSSGYGPHTVVLEEDLNFVPGKYMKFRAKVVYFSKRLRRARANGLGMEFIPHDGFCNFLLQVIYKSDPYLEVVVRRQGDLADKMNSAEITEPLRQSKRDRGCAEALLPKLYPEGTIIGEVRPVEVENGTKDGKRVPLKNLEKECEILDTELEVDCVCPYFRERDKYTVILLGDKHGFNYTAHTQFARPGKDIELLKEESMCLARDNILAFKRQKNEDSYEVHDDIGRLLKDEVVVLTSYREVLTPGQLEAIQQLKRFGKHVQLIRQRNKDCRICATLACQTATPGNVEQLLTAFTQIDVLYSANGTMSTPDKLMRIGKVREHIYTIRGIAHLQVYKVSGNLRILVHIYQPEDPKNLPHLVTYAQAYLFNQFRILRVPRWINTYVSWKAGSNIQNPMNRINTSLKSLELWEPQEGLYHMVGPNQDLVRIRGNLRGCRCESCKNQRNQPGTVIEKKFRQVFSKDPLKISENSSIPLNFTKGFNEERNQCRREAEVAGTILSILAHRHLMISCESKENFVRQYQMKGMGKDIEKAEHRNAVRKINLKEVQERYKRLKRQKRKEKDLKYTGRKITEADRQVRENYARIKKLQERVLKPPDAINEDEELEKVAMRGKMQEFDDLNIETKYQRLKPPPMDLMERFEKAEEDMESTSTDREIDEHVNHFPGEFDLETLMAQKHREDEYWGDCFPREKYPKNPNPEIEPEFIRIMDKHNSTLAKSPRSWRLMTIPPVSIPFDKTVPPIVHKYYRMNPIDDYILTKKVDDLVNNDLLTVVKPNQELFRNITRLFLVKHNSKSGAEMVLNKFDKTDLDNIDPGLFRIVADFRLVNNTILNSGYADYVMGTPQEIVARMGGYTHFISVDLKSAYRSIPVSDETKRRMTVRADCDLYRPYLLEFKSLVDGIAVAPQIFTQVIIDALHDLLDQVVVWIDDITIMANTAHEALQIMDKVLDRLGRINALVALDKMQLTIDYDADLGGGDQSTFSHMGFTIKTVVTKGKKTGRYICTPKLCISETKKQLFGSLAIPTTYDQVQSRLGCANYICDFIPNHAVNMNVFYEKLRKGASDKWIPDEAMQIAWERLLWHIQKAADLSIIKYNHTLHIQSDASLLGCGGVMSQDIQDEEGGHKNILAYYSKRFKLTYGIHNKRTSVFRELLGLDYCVQHWKRYIYACVRTCLTVDIASIVYMCASRFMTDDAHLARIIGRIVLMGTCFKIRHRPAKENEIADVLSRIKQRGDAKPGFNGEWIMAATGVPVSHLQLTKDFLDKAPRYLPEGWLDEKTEVTMRELIAHMCEQIARREDISVKSAKSKYKSLLETCQEKYAPIIREWDLKAGAADVDTEKVGTLPIVESGKVTARIACFKLTKKEQETLAMIDALDKAEDEKGQRPYHIDYTKYEKDTPTSMKMFKPAFLVRLQDRSPEVRQIKTEILENIGTPENLDKRHLNFRMLNNQLLVTRRDKTRPFSKYNRTIYLAEYEGLYCLYYLHLWLGHQGIEGCAANFRQYFDTGYLKGLCRIVSKSCSACTMYNPIRARTIHDGRLPRSPYVGHRAYIDVAKINLGYAPDAKPTDGRITDNKKLVDNLLIIQDSHSGRTAICPILGQKTTTLVEAIKMYQCTNIKIEQIHCDNAPSFYSNDFLTKLRPYGITGVTYSSPNLSTANSRVERFIRTLREVSWKLAQHNKVSSLWHIIYEANACINRRPVQKLAKYMPDTELVPSKEDIYYGMRPRNFEPNLETAIGEFVDVSERLKFRELMTKIIADYDADLDKILTENNAGVIVTHKLQVGDYVLIKDVNRLHHLGRGNPQYDHKIYLVIKLGKAKALLRTGWGRKTRKKKEQGISHLRKLAAPHAMQYMPPDVINHFGSPFTTEDMEKMSAEPEQFAEGIPIPPATKKQTRSQKAELVERKEKWPSMMGGDILDEAKIEAQCEIDENDDPEGDMPQDIYAMDTWPRVWPQYIAGEIEDMDPRVHVQEKALGEKMQWLMLYYEANGDPNAKKMAEKAYTRYHNKSSTPIIPTVPVGRGILQDSNATRSERKEKRVTFGENSELEDARRPTTRTLQFDDTPDDHIEPTIVLRETQDVNEGNLDAESTYTDNEEAPLQMDTPEEVKGTTSGVETVSKNANKTAATKRITRSLRRTEVAQDALDERPQRTRKKPRRLIEQ